MNTINDRHWASFAVRGTGLPSDAPHYLLYAVGVCPYPQSAGGWAFGLFDANGLVMDSAGYDLCTDASTIALQATVAALRFAARAPAIIITDSNSVIAGLTQGRPRGARWRPVSSAPRPVDLWREACGWRSPVQAVRRAAAWLPEEFQEVRERAENARREAQEWGDARAVAQSCGVLRRW